MRIVIDGVGHYKCNYCKRDFTEEQVPHLSIVIGPRSGMVDPENSLPGWRFRTLFRAQRVHLCLPDEAPCLPEYVHHVMTAGALGVVEEID